VYRSEKEKYLAIKRQLELEFVIRDLEKKVKKKESMLYRNIEVISGQLYSMSEIGKQVVQDPITEMKNA